ncbi:phage tail protein [Vibrio gazogenes]|uniref:Phage tail-collar fibre protein n=1 Tax=Vibrio gazogenes DSM 21264 = NBRC 103151 TaxID=1123492 RepID=A0A1M5C9R8_VIBGA|nr:phage tail protein [Vibrio gazogenes]USP16278.1 phage tail protein [Vibrio gazogenes]SHF51514.1 Phage tail-collar fibre protein [Vibrio gazogenes DSM 21264] [Vibrio gazogenes DSM 21264 = NBRC 103151]SJN55398.1 Tail fiber protein [Vibrio gazogenes]
MSQVVIPLEFERYLQDRIINGQAPDMNEMIFAYLPDLDSEQPIDRHLGLPNPSYWVYQQDVMQQAKLNDDAIIYSVVIPGTVKAFTFNAIYLHDKQTANSCGLVVHKMTETKEPEMSSVRSCVQQYSGAAAIAQIHVTPESWQIDYQSRLYGMDDDLRLACLDLFGDASFFGNGFQIKVSGSDYLCSPGVGYVGGLRCVNHGQTEITDVLPASGIYLDVSWQGGVVSRWTSNWKLTASTTSLTDYVADGVQHYVTQIARVETDGRVTDLRHLGLDENKLPDATTTTKGVVIRATDNEVLNGQGTGTFSTEQFRKVMSRYGFFGSTYGLGYIADNSAFDSAPHGLISFSSKLPLNSQIGVAWQGIKLLDGSTYTIIAASNNAGDPKLAFYHSTQNKWTSVLTNLNAQFAPYQSDRVYRTGDVCTTYDSGIGERKFWQMYAGPNMTCVGKDPEDPLNRHDGWSDPSAPFWWIPYGGKVGQPFFWLDTTPPEEAVMEINADLPISVYWRLAKAYPHLVTGDTINTGEIRGEFLRVLDQGRGVDSGRSINSWQNSSAFVGDGDGYNILIPNLGSAKHKEVLGFEFDNATDPISANYAALNNNDQNAKVITSGAKSLETANTASDFARLRVRNIARPMAIYI